MKILRCFINCHFINYKKIILILILFPAVVFSQNGNQIKKILDQLGTNARSYLLSANRPGYSVSPYTTGKGVVNLSISALYSEEIIDLPASVSYGVSEKVEVFLDVPFYTQSYNFSGNKITGFGDVVAGARYNFHNSKYFSHAVQTAIKIPSADKNKELGTGKVDFHFGLAQGFSYKKFSYDVSAEINMLRRRDLPQMNINAPPYVRRVIDSLNSVYNYKYERELVISGGPGYDFSDRFSVYTGLSFSRNFKLDYNTLQSYSGIGFLISDRTSLGLGATFGIKNSSSWALSTGVSVIF